MLKAQINMNVAAYFHSQTREFEALKDRVRNLIDDRHWLTDGEWKESVLRSSIASRLPDTVKIGRGFVIAESGPTAQCDILLYKASCPILFRDGELVFITPDALLGIIEVKTKTTKYIFREAIKKLSSARRELKLERKDVFLGLFSYDNEIVDKHWLLKELQRVSAQDSETIDLVNLGCSTFIRFWEDSPRGGDENYKMWHAYNLKNMSAGYFIGNVLDAIAPDSIGRHSKLWFPEGSKELQLVARQPHMTSPHYLERSILPME